MQLFHSWVESTQVSVYDYRRVKLELDHSKKTPYSALYQAERSLNLPTPRIFMSSSQNESSTSLFLPEFLILYCHFLHFLKSLRSSSVYSFALTHWLTFSSCFFSFPLLTGSNPLRKFSHQWFSWSLWRMSQQG